MEEEIRVLYANAKHTHTVSIKNKLCVCFVFCLFLSDTAKCQGSPTELRLSCTWVMSTPLQFLIPLETETSGNTAELDSILVCKAETDISK